ncbi:MAG: SsrA-binding protein SmpB [Myxococcota bacterium]
MGSRQSDKNNRTILTNRKARHDYAIEETFEAGLALRGSEVKSIRDGRVSVTDGYVDVRDGELWLVNVHVQEYPWAHQQNHEPTRPRKLLLKRREMDKIVSQVESKGYTAVPLKFYLTRGIIKVLIGLGKGKRKVDKRHDLKAREAKREMDRAMKR